MGNEAYCIYTNELHQTQYPEAKDKSWEKKFIVLEEGLEATQAKMREEGGEKGEKMRRPGGNCSVKRMCNKNMPNKKELYTSDVA